MIEMRAFSGICPEIMLASAVYKTQSSGLKVQLLSTFIAKARLLQALKEVSDARIPIFCLRQRTGN